MKRKTRIGKGEHIEGKKDKKRSRGKEFRKGRNQERRSGRISVAKEKESRSPLNLRCQRPNGEKLVRQLYGVCEKSGFCINQYLKPSDPTKASRNINEIFARFSYVSPQLMIYITSDKFRRRYMYDGQNLVKNNNSFSYVGPGWTLDAPYPLSLNGLKDIDGAYPDPFYRVEHNLTCPEVDHTIHHCFGKCKQLQRKSAK